MFTLPSAARGAAAFLNDGHCASRVAGNNTATKPMQAMSFIEGQCIRASARLQFAHAAGLKPRQGGLQGMAFDLTVNGSVHRVDADPQTPLLWVIRDHAGLTGTKFSCGIGQCGACTVHVDGRAVRSCSVPASTAVGKPILTIEGVSPDGSHPIQMAWKEFDAPQCGYCQSGMLMAAAALLKDKPAPSDADIDAAMTNICRCGTYNRVRAAIKMAARGGRA